MKKYLLVTDAAAVTVEKLTGLRGHDTPLGALVEAPPDPFEEGLRMESIKSRLYGALHPRLCNCSVVHMPPCKFAYTMT